MAESPAPDLHELILSHTSRFPRMHVCLCLYFYVLVCVCVCVCCVHQFLTSMNASVSLRTKRHRSASASSDGSGDGSGNEESVDEKNNTEATDKVIELIRKVISPVLRRFQINEQTHIDATLVYV